MKLLHLIASPRGAESRTLTIANEFLNSLKEKEHDLIIDQLDLFKMKLPEVLGSAVDAKYAFMSGGTLDEKAKSSWIEIEKLAKDFMSYDMYLISCPMWNFTIPYKLKHYIDIIMQAGILFSFTENGVEGLAKDKKMFCISSSGNDYSEGGPMHKFDFIEPYLRSIFGFAGIHDITFVKAQPMDYDPEITQANLNKAKDEARLITQEVNI